MRAASVGSSVTHFSPEVYRGHPQNWAIVQDADGIVYVGNMGGVLVYDGREWSRIDTKRHVVRSLALGHDGIVYVGLFGDFGYLSPDSTGTPGYISLLDRVSTADSGFTDVWSTHATRDGVYFQTYERLFRWDGQALRSWSSRQAFRTSFAVRDRVYIRDQGVGLFEVVGDSLRPAPFGEAFAGRFIYLMVPHGDAHVLVGTSNDGFWRYGADGLTPFPTEVDALLKTFSLYHGTALPGGRYALATLGGGTFVIDARGRLVQAYTTDTGLPDNWVNYVYADRQERLWMAMDSAGVVRVDGSPSPDVR